MPSSNSESVIATNDDDSSPGLQINEYDDNKIRKIYLDTQEKRFEIPEKRDIKTREYQTERNKEWQGRSSDYRI